ncbi:uncharacterized protein LOC123680156 [Harmonia axyridis]|uniref:uncharacterized protein LOC123680156 n=1 Tax=Harmonia axyridis TaxID=115357 RepID=UPI001E2798B2|nr:uncharacterized protein LOC123680156 [Harmonia axyridis]
MNKYAIVSLALMAIASAAEILQAPSFETVKVSPDGSVVHDVTYGGNVVGGVSPIVGSYYIPTVRYTNVGGLINNGYGVVNVIPTNSVPVATGIQGPSVRTVIAGPDGSSIDSFASGSVLSDDASVLVAPSVQTFYKYADNLAVSPYVVPTVDPGSKSYYAPGYYSGFVPLPYSGSVVSGPSGTIVSN